MCQLLTWQTATATLVPGRYVQEVKYANTGPGMAGVPGALTLAPSLMNVVYAVVIKWIRSR